MTHNIPQFYNQWISDNLGLSPSSDFVYHEGEQYAYLIMGGPEDAPGNLSLFSVTLIRTMEESQNS